MIEYKVKLSVEFEAVLKHCDELWVAVAMISDNGFKYIQEHIDSSAKQNYVVGIGLPTSPNVLRKLKDKESKGLIRTRIYNQPNQLFHPKVYIIKKQQKLIVFVGSGNCTIGGFIKNCEVTIMTDDVKICNDLLGWVKELFDNGEEITESFLDSYNERFFQERIKRINKDKEELTKVLTEPNYYVLNTNTKHGEDGEYEMLLEKKVAAYFEPWKYKIENLKKGDRVFLYRSGGGIIAKGIASGITLKKEYRGNPKHKNQEYYQKLYDFKRLSRPFTAKEIKQLSGKNYIFRKVMFRIDKRDGEKIWKKK